MRTLVLCLALAAGPAGAVGRATDPGALPFQFADCAGRLMADLEDQWLRSDPAADDTKAARTRMVDLLDAVTPAGAERRVLARRVEARAAQRALLSRAAHDADPGARRWSAERARDLTRACRALILTGG